jgi:hypothetical protein
MATDPDAQSGSANLVPHRPYLCAYRSLDRLGEREGNDHHARLHPM